MSFAHPSYLWALLGLLVPIAIHLWSKREAKTIKVGSVEFLSESQSKQSSSIQLNEWWLLVLRMLIITIITMAMAKPRWGIKTKNAALTYIVEESLLTHKKFSKILDSLAAQHEIRLLKKGFPIWEPDTSVQSKLDVPYYWQLATEMEMLKTDSIVIFSTGYLQGLKGMRPETGKPIQWMIIDAMEAIDKPIVAYRRQQEVKLFSVQSNAEITRVGSKNVNSNDKRFSFNSQEDSLTLIDQGTNLKIPITNEKPIEISMVYMDSLIAEKQYIEAALKAISAYTGRAIRVTATADSLETSTDTQQLTIWLTPKSTPKNSTTLLKFAEDTLAQKLIEPGIEPNAYILTQRITSENAVSQRLTEQLLGLLDLDTEVGELVPKVDLRKVSETELRTNSNQNQVVASQLASWVLPPYLWFAIFLLLCMERIVANQRNQ